MRIPTVISLLFSIVSVVFAEFSAEDCRELGLIKSQLFCSSCNSLTDYGLVELKEHCLECCQKDTVSDGKLKVYPRAVLEVCTCKFGAYPQIQAFIKSDRPAKFPNLTIKYVRGLDPIVKLMDEGGNVKETLSINKWNTDTVQEFFETRLAKVENDDYLQTNRV
ncbi:selenoprotein F [Anopheles ziemanni]|uniref:selenoprotein F n=1 Tax=Anopheles coustani TaxID=139045 RepID=UPI00265B2E65|nr:selenoprotein F [Anopheles coustani]XP_058166413.1 selenoprotein F [Anopheles ziemanni]